MTKNKERESMQRALNLKKNSLKNLKKIQIHSLCYIQIGKQSQKNQSKVV